MMYCHEEAHNFRVEVGVYSNPNRWQDPPEPSVAKIRPTSNVSASSKNHTRLHPIDIDAAFGASASTSHKRRTSSTPVEQQSLASTLPISSGAIVTDSVFRLVPQLEDLELQLLYNKRKRLDLGQIADVSANEPVIACQCDRDASNEPLVRAFLTGTTGWILTLR